MAFIDVITGRASLDITPFTTALNNAGRAVDTFVAKVNSTSGAGVAGMKMGAEATSGWGAAVERANTRLVEMEKSLNMVYRAGAQISHVGSMFGLLGGVIEGITYKSMEAGSAFDFWEKKVEAVTAVHTRGAEQTDLFRRAIEGVTIAVGAFKPEDVAHSVYLWTSALNENIKGEYDLSAAMRQIETVLKGATMAGIDAQTMVRGIAQVLGEFSMSVDKAGYVTAVLTDVMHSTETEMTDLIGSFKMMGPMAAAMGITFADVATALGELGDAGVRGTRAGTGFSRMLQGMAHPSKEAESILQGILVTNRGLSGSWRDGIEPGGKFVGLFDKLNTDGTKTVGMLGQLHQGLSKMTPAMQQQALETIFTANGYREILPLLEAYDKELKNSDGVIQGASSNMHQFAKDLADEGKMAELFGEKWEIVASTIKVQVGSELNRLKLAFYDLGTVAQGSVLPLLKLFANIADGVRNWAHNNSELSATIIRMITAIGAASVVIGALAFVFGRLIEAFAVVQGSTRAFIELMNLMRAASLPITLAIGAVVLAFIAFRSAIASSPELAANFASFVGSIRQLTSFLLDIFSNVIKFIDSIFRGDWANAWVAFENIAASAIIGFGDVFSGLGKIVSTILNQVVDFLDKKFNGLGTAMKTWGRNVMASFAGGFIEAINAYVVPAINAVISMIASFLQGFSPPKNGPLRHITDWGSNVMQAYLEGFKHADYGVIDEAAKILGDHLKIRMTMDPTEKGYMSPTRMDSSGQEVGVYSDKMKDLRQDMANIMQAFREGKTVGEDMWKGIMSAMGPYAENVRAAIQANIDLESALDAVEAKKLQMANLESSKAQYESEIEGIQNTINENNLRKDGLAILKSEVEARKDALEAERSDLEDQKAGIQSRKDDEQSIIDKIKEQVDAINDSKNLIQQRIKDLQDEKTVIQEQIDAIQEKYRIEHQAQQESLTLLKDQLDLSAAIRNAALRPLQAAASEARNVYDLQREKDELAREPLEIAVDKAKETGNPAAIKSAESALNKMKAAQDEVERPLKLAYDQANYELHIAERKADLEHKTEQDQYTLLKDQEDISAAKNKLDTETQISGLKKQQQAKDIQIETLKKQENSYDKQLDALKQQQHGEDQKMKGLDNEMKVIDRRLQAISRDEKHIDRQAAVFDKQMKELDRANTSMQHHIQEIQLHSIKPINDAIIAIQNELKTILEPNLAKAKAHQQNTKDALGLDDQEEKDIEEENKLIDAYNAWYEKQAKAKKGKKPPKGKLVKETPFEKLMDQLHPGDATGFPQLGDVTPADWAARTQANMGPGGPGGGFFKGQMDDIIHKLNIFDPISKALDERKEEARKTVATHVDGVLAWIDGVLGSNFSDRGKPVKKHKRRPGEDIIQSEAEDDEDDTGWFARKQGKERGDAYRKRLSGAQQDIMPGVLGMDLATLLPKLFGQGLGGFGAITRSEDMSEKIARLMSGGKALEAPTMMGKMALPTNAFEGLGALGKGDIFGSMVGGLKTILPLLGRLTSLPYEIVANGLRGIMTVFTGLSTIFPKITDGLLAIAKGFDSFSSAGTVAWASTGNVLGIIMTTIGELGKAFFIVFSRISFILENVFEPFAKTGGGSFIFRTLIGIVERIGGAFRTAFSIVETVLTTALGLFREVAGVVRAVIIPFERLWGVLSRLPLIGGILKAVPIVGWIITIIQAVQTAKEAWEKNWFGIRDIIQSAWAQIKPIFDDIGKIFDSNMSFGDKFDVIRQDIGKIAGVLGGALETLFKNVFSSIGEKIQGAGGVGKIVKGIGDFLGQEISNLLVWLGTQAIPWALQLVAGFFHVLAKFFDGLTAKLNESSGPGGKGGIGETIGGLLSGAAGWLIKNGPSIAKAIFEALKLVIITAIELLLSISGFFGTLLIRLLTSLIIGIGEGLSKLGGMLLDKIKEGMKSNKIGGNGAVDPFEGIKKDINEFHKWLDDEAGPTIGGAFSRFGKWVHKHASAAGEEIGQAFSDLGSNFRPGGPVGSAFSDFGGMLDAAATNVGNIFNHFGTIVHAGLGLVLTNAVIGATAIANYLSGPPTIGDLFSALGAAVSTALTSLGTWFSEKWTAFSTMVSTEYTTVHDFVQNTVIPGIGGIFDSLGTRVSGAVGSVGTFFSDKWGNFSGFITSGYKTVHDFIVGTVIPYIGAGFDNLGTTITTTVQGVVTAFTTEWGKFWDMIGKKFDELTKALPGLIKLATDALGDLAKKANDTLTTVRLFLTQYFNETKTHVETKFKEISDAIPGYITLIQNAITETFITIIGAIKTILYEPFEGLFTWFGDKIKAITKFIQDIKDLTGQAKVAAEAKANAENPRPAAHQTGTDVTHGTAAGGNENTSGLTLVGEKGPEILNIPGGSKILSNDAIGRYVSNAVHSVFRDMKGINSSVNDGLSASIQTLSAAITKMPTQRVIHLHVDKQYLNSEADIHYWADQMEYAGRS